MHIKNNPDFKTVWQLANDWAGKEPDKTDLNAISPELRIAIDRLIRAIGSREISARWKGYRIFFEDSFLSTIFDFRHTIWFYLFLMHNKLSKDYLDNLYVKRNEVITWCDKVALLDPPPCWAIKKLSDSENVIVALEDEDNTGWYDRLTEQRKKKVACLELAKKLWKENPNQTYEEIHNHSIMKQYGNPSVFSPDSFQKWANEFSSEFAKKGGRRKKSKE